MRDRKIDEELFHARQFPKLTLGAIFFFSQFARANEWVFRPEARSFRAFISAINEENEEKTRKGSGDGSKSADVQAAPRRSHRILVKIVDRIEYQMQRLIIEKEYRHGDGQMYAVASYAEGEAVKAKRVGRLTRYGKAWRAFAEHLSDLYDMMIHVDDDDIISALKQHQELLAKQRQSFERTPRPAQDFDGL